MTEPSAPKLYPDLQENNVNTITTHGFRLQKINEVQKEIQMEKNNREKTYKKYKKVIKTFLITETITELVGVASGSVGIAALAGGVTVPIGLVLEGLAIGCGGGSLLTKYVNSKLRPKAKKHEDIRILAESKLNTINELISRAIEDGNIDEEEFKLVLNEQKKFMEMKEAIRRVVTPKDSLKKDNNVLLQEALDKQKKEIIQQFLNSK